MLGHTLYDALYFAFGKMEKIHSILFYSIGMCRMRRFLTVLRSFFRSSLSCIFPATLFHQLLFHPPSLHLAIYFVIYLLVLWFPNSYTILFWELYGKIHCLLLFYYRIIYRTLTAAQTQRFVRSNYCNYHVIKVIKHI
jgi:hypothetical protein